MSEKMWAQLERYPEYEVNELGKVRSITTKKYKKTVHDLLGRELVVLYEPDGYATCWYIEDLLAVVFGPNEGQTAIVKSPELVQLMPEPEVVPVKKINKRCKKIQCIDTGEVFASYSACAKHFGFNYDKFYDTYKAKGTFQGYTFKDVE